MIDIYLWNEKCLVGLCLDLAGNELFTWLSISAFCFFTFGFRLRGMEFNCVSCCLLLFLYLFYRQQLLLTYRDIKANLLLYFIFHIKISTETKIRKY